MTSATFLIFNFRMCVSGSVVFVESLDILTLFSFNIQYYTFDVHRDHSPLWQLYSALLSLCLLVLNCVAARRGEQVPDFWKNVMTILWS